MNPPATSLAYFGPEATFTQEALLAEPDLAAAELTPLPSITSVLEAVARGEVDGGFVPIENAIEGTVSATIDGLIHDVDLHIQREVVMDIHLHLMVPPGTTLAQIRSVSSYPHALAQCQKFLAKALPDAEQHAANSTADAARLLGASRSPDGAAIAPRLAAERYGLSILAEDVEDHPDNQTRFVLVARTMVPKPTGHDKTSIVCFQRADHPGSLHGIIGQFAARNINLTKLESRPTKQALGDYCFVIDLSGHVGDEVVADCLRDLHAGLAGVKFLGSYPAAGEHAPEQRRQADAAWQAADDWLKGLRSSIG
ncbi:MAG TPA: prephenate dehydratase [Acidimicrobiales bacterium]|nr:prephenate dehydratase [Acidimicrobiales bacterium]